MEYEYSIKAVIKRQAAPQISRISVAKIDFVVLDIAELGCLHICHPSRVSLKGICITSACHPNQVLDNLVLTALDPLLAPNA